MKKTKWMCLITILILAISGCENREDNHQSGQPTVDGFGTDSSQTTGAITTSEMTGYTPEATSAPADDLVIEFGRVYNQKEYYEQIHTQFQNYHVGLRIQANMHFDEEVASGRIPEKITYEYMGTAYELELDCDKYIPADQTLNLKYSNYEHGISVTLDSETMGEKYFLSNTQKTANNVPIKNLERKSEEELIRISNDYFVPLFNGMGIREDEYSVYITERKGDMKHVDGSAKFYQVVYLYNNIHSWNSVLAYMSIDEYGIISDTSFHAVNFYLDDDVMAKIADIDYNKLFPDLEKYREPGCNCGLRISTQLLTWDYEGAKIGIMNAHIVPDEKDTSLHIHDYINHPMFVLVDLS